MICILRILIPVFAASAFGIAIALQPTKERQLTGDSSDSGYIITAGGWNSNFCNAAYALNLYSGEWLDLPPLPQGMFDFNLVLRDSNVYAVGGFNGKWINTTLVLSMKDTMWKTCSDLIFNYGRVLSVGLNVSIYAVGGYKNDHTLQVMGCSGAWNRLASSIYPHNAEIDAITVLNDKIYILGCHHRDEVYDPATDTWTAINMTNQDRCGGRIVGLNGYIYVIGGSNTTNERYDPATGNLIHFAADLYTPVTQAGVVTDGKTIYVVGGYTVGGYSNKVQFYRPDLDVWQSMSEYPVANELMGTVFVEHLPNE